MAIEAVTLEGSVVRLEPLKAEHSADLFAVTHPDTFRYFPMHPDEWTQEGFDDFIERMMARLGIVPFAVVLRETGKAVGSSSYLDIREKDRGLEIGASWIATDWRGTAVNPEMKLLMLQNAFETLGMVRVQLKADARNELSIAAMRKLGAVYEGTWRKHYVMPDGYLRDTVMFSITDDEWPTVKASLTERIATWTESSH